MIDYNDQPVELRDIPHLHVRHRGKVVLWWLLCGVIMIAAIGFLPRYYTSDAMLFLRLGRENVTLDPTATTGTTIQVQETREAQANSTCELLLSRSLLDRVVEKVTPEVILNERGSQSWGQFSLLSRAKAAFYDITDWPTIDRSEQATTALRSSLRVSGNHRSNMIEVQCTTKDPKVAQQILQALLELYQDQHFSANRTAGASKFFAEQSANLKQQLDAADEEVRNAKNDSQLVSVAAEQKSLQDQLMQVESLSMASEALLSSTEASIGTLQNKIEVLPERLATQATSGIPHVGADLMRQELYKLQVHLRELEAKLGEGHPVVVTVREQVKQSETTLKSQPEERVQTVTAVHPARQALELDLARAEVSRDSLRAKSESLKEQFANLQGRIQALNKNEVMIANLERKSSIAAKAYRSYVDHWEQARIMDALEAHRISNVNVVQPPSLVFQPVSPKPSVVFAFGMMAAIIGSVCLVVKWERDSRKAAAAAEVEAEMNQRPIVMAIATEDQENLHSDADWPIASQA